MSAKLSQNLGQQVVVDNRPAPDHHRIGVHRQVGRRTATRSISANATTHAINASLYTKLPYDSVKDFAFISLVASTPLLLGGQCGLAGEIGARA